MIKFLADILVYSFAIVYTLITITIIYPIKWIYSHIPLVVYYLYLGLAFGSALVLALAMGTMLDRYTDIYGGYGVDTLIVITIFILYKYSKFYKKDVIAFNRKMKKWDDERNEERVRTLQKDKLPEQSHSNNNRSTNNGI